MSDKGMTWPFGDLPMFGFGAILCDPPWYFQNYSEKEHDAGPLFGSAAA